MVKINFKEPKYILPIVVYLGLVFAAYYVLNAFNLNDNTAEVSTDHLNEELPEARESEMKDKLSMMSSVFDDDGAYSAISEMGEDVEEKETIDQGYSEAELDRIDAAEAERLRQQKQLEDMEKSLAESRKHINSSGRNNDDYDYSDEDNIQNIINETRKRQFAIQQGMGIGVEDPEEAAQKRRNDSIAKARIIEKEKNRPNLVIKSKDTNADKFITVSGMTEDAAAPLIRAMIDKTTKAHEGTRLRFKLLDDVIVKGNKLPKGTYLYGTVTGFGQQRVMATVSSILIGGKFIKVSLAVYDNDGMEGFYVPESAFRSFLKQAGAQGIQSNINIDNGDAGSGFNGQAMALQALQNVYNSATSAVAANISRNKAKIKYNTVVYLINSEDSK